MASLDFPDLVTVVAATAEPARSLLREALVCLDAGAYRGAIALTWSAVVADLMTKLRRFDAAGPEPLRARIAALPPLRALRSQGQADPADAVALEQSLLAIAEVEFDMLSPVERTELARLVRDRHHAVHPTMLPLVEPFVPSAALAQAHLRSALTYLIERDGLQGVHALDALWAELASEYFPRSAAAAEIHLRASPLRTGRPATIRAAVIEVARRVLVDLRPVGERARHHAALAGLLRVHETLAIDTLVTRLPSMIAGLDDTHFPNVIALLSAIVESWQWIGAPAQNKARIYVAETRGPHELDVIHDALGVPELYHLAYARVQELGPRPLRALIERGDRNACASRAVELVCAASDIVEGERLALALIPPVAPALTAQSAEALITALTDKDYLFASWKLLGELLPDIFDDLRRHHEALFPAWKHLYTRTLFDHVPEKTQRLRAQILGLYPELGSS